MFKKIIVTVIIIGLISPGLYFSFPKKAEAGISIPVPLPVIETNPGVLIPTGANSLANITHLAKWILDIILKRALKTLKRRMLDAMVDEIVGWVQGGGEPKFVSDWEGFLKDEFNKAVGKVIEETAPWLCEPFRFQVQMALSPPRKFSEEVSCTLDDVVENINSFYRDFRNGGWIAYHYIWRPENNYYGASLMAMDEMIERGMAAKEAAKSEAIAGEGFLSTKKCETIDGKEVCEITTPGSLIGKTVSKAIGSDIDWIVNEEVPEGTDMLAEYIGAIADAAINRLIMEGMNGLMGMSTSRAPAEGYVTRESYPERFDETWREYYEAKEKDLEGTKTYYQTRITRDLNYRKESLNLADSIVSTISEAIKVREGLLSCQKERGYGDIKKTESKLESLKTKLAKARNERNSLYLRIRKEEILLERVKAAKDIKDIGLMINEIESLINESAAYNEREHYRSKLEAVRHECNIDQVRMELERCKKSRTYLL